MSKKTQWWITTIIAIGMLLVGILTYISRNRPPTPKSVSSVQIGNNANISNNRDVNIAGRDIIQNIITQGVDTEKLGEYLSRFKTDTVDERKLEIKAWRNQGEIDDSTEKALNLVAERIGADLKASQETIRQLREEGNVELADLLERLNKAFKKGLDELEKKESEILSQLEKKTARDKIEVYLNTANKYHAALQHKKAISRYENALELQEKHIGTENERFAFILNQLGFINDTLADHDKALEYYEKALKIWLKVFDEEHPNVATFYNNIGAAWYSKGEYDKAIEYYEKALNIDLKVFGKKHPEVAIRYNNIGAAWDSKGEYDKAIEYYDKALKIDLKVFGKEHPNVAIRYNNIGAAWDSKGEYDKAIEYYDKALKILKIFLPLNHPNIKITEKNLKAAQEAR